MIRIGIVDLDTSHGELYAPIVNAMDGLAVAAVWDGGSVRPPGFADKVARDLGLDGAAESLDEVLDTVDVAMLLGQDWDLHVERARPFLEAGKRVFIDKPIVGRMRDVTELIALSERTGVPVLAGSSLRYAPPIVALRERREDFGQIVSAFASGPHDPFNYGTHAMAMLGGFFGPGFRSATPIRTGRTELLLLEHDGGVPVVLQLGAPDGWDYSFFLALTTDRSGVIPTKLVCDDAFGHELFSALMAEFARFARGGDPSVALPDLLEEVTMCLAIAEARRTGRRVEIGDVPAGAGFDGAAFTRAYAQAGGWQGAAGGGPKQPSAEYHVAAPA